MLFRMLQRDGFSSRSSSAAQVGGNLVGFTSRVILTRSVDSLQGLFSIYPKAGTIFRSSIRAANLDKGINGAKFQLKRERILILRYLLASYKDLTVHQTRTLCHAVLVVDDVQKTLGLLKDFTMEANKKVVLSEEVMCRDAHSYAASISDLPFLSYVKTVSDTNFLHDAALECVETAYDCLTAQLESLVHGITVQIISIQKEECDKQAQREDKNQEEKEKELKDSRANFVRQIEDLCRERSKSYVPYSSASWAK